MSEGDLVFPLKEREFILSIKKGEYNVEEFKLIVDSYKMKFKALETHNSLPSKPDIKKILDLVYRIQMSKYDINGITPSE